MFGRSRRGGAPRATKAGQSGQALLELALIAPILIMMLAGLVQFGLIFETQIGINNAIREAARRGATLATPDIPTAQANATWTLDELNTLLDNVQNHDSSRDTLEVCFFTPAPPYKVDASNLSQVMVRIKDSYRHPLFLPIVDLILDQIDGVPDRSLEASNAAQFHVEQPGPVDIGTGAYARSPSGNTADCAQ